MSNCNDSELVTINKVFGVFSYRRVLRTRDIDSLSMSERSLQQPPVIGGGKTTLSDCRSKCRFYAPGTCQATGCKGVRKLSADANEKSDRSLLTCTTEVDEIHAKLDYIQNLSTTSLSCKNYLEKSKRRSECYADYEYGQIEGVRVWNITSTAQTVVHSFVAPGGNATICKSLYTNFEALTEPCVSKAKLVLRGPNNNLVRETHESVPPFSLFLDTGLILKGEYLKNVGTYRLIISPEYDSAKKKEFTINVVNCL